MQNNKEVLANFFAHIIQEVSEGTSDNYAIMVLKRFIRNMQQEFPFVQYIHLDSLSSIPEEILIDEEINSVENSKMSDFIRKMIHASFPELLKHLLIKKMNPDLLDKLNNMGLIKKYVWA